MAKKPKNEAQATPAPAASPRAGKLPCNEARGEARLWIDDVELIIAAELGRLSALSSALQCKSLNDLFLRLSNVEVTATIAALEVLTIKGDALAAISKITLKHFPACSSAFNAALSHHFDGEEGNPLAVAETA